MRKSRETLETDLRQISVDKQFSYKSFAGAKGLLRLLIPLQPVQCCPNLHGL